MGLMNNLTTQEIKEGFLDLVKAELSTWGIDPNQVSLDHNEIKIEDHLVDQTIFISKSQWTAKNLKIRAYTVDSGKIIFMVEHEKMDLLRNNEELENILDKEKLEVENKMHFLKTNFLESLAEFHRDIPLEDRIPKKLKDKYKITTLSDVESWKAKVMIRNCSRDDAPKIGEFDNVGYTMIGIETGTIVPIARQDEHHRGHDLIYDLMEKKLIPQDTYHPIYFHSDYVDFNDQVALQAFKIWRKLGGKNIVIKNMNGERYQVTLDDYIKAEGLIKMNKGELFPIGKNLIDQLKEVARLISETRKDERKSKALYKQAIKTFNYYTTHVDVFFSDDKKQAGLKEIMVAEALGGEAGIQKLEQFFFGFNSFKNKLHDEIRKALDPNAGSWTRRDMEGLFGDIELANHLMGSF